MLFSIGCTFGAMFDKLILKAKAIKTSWKLGVLVLSAIISEINIIIQKRRIMI